MMNTNQGDRSTATPDAPDWLPSGFARRKVQANGIQIACAVGGSGPPMVLLHGWPQTAQAWGAVMPTLAEKYTVVVPDLRGCGSTDRPADGYKKVEQVEDVRGLLAVLGLKGPIILIGHDIGGMVAYPFAAKYPDEVAALVLIDLLLPGSGLEAIMDPAKGGSFHFGLFMTPDLPELLFEGHELAFMQWWFNQRSTPGAIHPEAVAAYGKAYSGTDRLRGGFSHFRTFLEDAKDNQRLSKQLLPMPVLAIGGEKSVGGKLSESIEQLCTNFTGTIAPCGHQVADEMPDWLLATLAPFLATVGG